MEKYFVIYISNGNLAINEITEHNSKDAAISKYFDVCHLMFADATVQSASVVILDAYMNRVENYHQDVSKQVVKQATKQAAKK